LQSPDPSQVPSPAPNLPESIDRRQFGSDIAGMGATAGMVGGLVAGYGTLAYMAGRFMYPSGGPRTQWTYVAIVDEIPPGSSLTYETPAGAKVVIARRGQSGQADDFIALSSTCPHLGCQVHWEPQHDPPRFFCPCHNGTFNPAGVATSGPPYDAGQSLPQYPLKVEGGLLFIEIPTDTIRRPAAGQLACNDSQRMEPAEEIV